MAKVLLLMILVPLVELYGLLWMAQYTSATFTFAWVIFAGVVGVLLIRRQHLRTWRLAEQELAAGRLPAAQVFDGALIILAGVLLIIPGVLTDVCAVVLLLSPVRRWIRKSLRRRLEKRMSDVGSRVMWHGTLHHDQVIESRVIESQPPAEDDGNRGTSHPEKPS